MTGDTPSSAMISRALLAYTALGAGGGVLPSRAERVESGGERLVRGVLVGVIETDEEGMRGRGGDIMGRFVVMS